jgi:hypothetical protein
MPTNHGIYRKQPVPAISGQRLNAAEAMVFRYGILQIFHALKTGSCPAIPYERRRAAQLEHHFRNLCSRFVFALQEVNGFLQEIVHSYSPGGLSNMRPYFLAECLADHILTYLNTIVDDVAIVTALATGCAGADQIDNMGKLRNPNNRDDPALNPVRTLL